VEQLGKHNVVLRCPDAETETETIIPWNIAKEKGSLTSKEVKVWSDKDHKFLSKGQRDAFNSWEDTIKALQEAACSSHYAERSYYAGGPDCSLVNINWKHVNEKAKKAVRHVLDKNPNLKNRSKEKVVDQRTLQELFKTIQPKVREATKIKSGVGVITDIAGAAAWAAGMAQTFSNENVTDLDKAIAVTGIVPGLGQILGIINGIGPHHAETVALNSVALAAVTASQSIPLIGKLTDVVSAGYAIVQGVVAILELLPWGRPRTDIPQFNPLTRNHVTIGWLSQYDQRIIALGPSPGPRTQFLVVQVDKKAPEDYTFPIVEFRGTVSDDQRAVNRKLEADFSRIDVFQNGRAVPVRCTEQSEDQRANIRAAVVCQPVWPITVSRTRPLIIRFAYYTSNNTCTRDGCFPQDPAVAVRAGPPSKLQDDRTVLSTNWKPAADSSYIKIGYKILPH
jgi:hypothetical protein